MILKSFQNFTGKSVAQQESPFLLSTKRIVKSGHALRISLYRSRFSQFGLYESLIAAVLLLN